MITAIHKYPLRVEGLQVIAMPKRAQLLCVQIQDGKPCIWARVDPSDTPKLRWFRLFGTGHQIDTDAEHHPIIYVGTVQLDGFVWHVFEAAP